MESFKFIDITEEAKEKYQRDTVSRIVSPDGSIHDPFDKKFFREPTYEEADLIALRLMRKSKKPLPFTYYNRIWEKNEKWASKIFEIPDGWITKEFPVYDIMSFKTWARNYYGLCVLREGKEPDLDYSHKYGYVLFSKKDPEEVLAVVIKKNI